MSDSGKLHWGRALLGGLLAELCLFAVTIPIFLRYGEPPLHYIAPAGSLVLCFAFAVWVGRRLESRFVLHGILVGVVATLLYVAVTRAQPEPVAYLLAHVLKLVGGAAGGYVAGRRTSTA